MFWKLVMFGIVIGVGAYYYDLNTAPKKVMDAEYVSMDTDIRCRQHHESMCKYFMKVRILGNKMEYTFRVPRMYYHGMDDAGRKARRYPLVFKSKKIFPEAILGLAPKYEKEIEPIIKTDG
ncbi:MAG: hypothetical protein ACAI44_26125 [Candidatus Sericytochromatia bacterium]